MTTTKSIEIGAYRVYALDADGLVVRARLLEARADDDAASVASELRWPRWQLWTGTRLIADSSEARCEGKSRHPGVDDLNCLS